MFGLLEPFESRAGLKSCNYPMVKLALNTVFRTHFRHVISSEDADFTLKLLSCQEVKLPAAIETALLVRTSGIELVLLIILHCFF